MEPYRNRIQEIVNSLHLGLGFRLMTYALFVLATVLLYTYYTVSEFRGLRDPEAMDYAQQARRVAMGRGFTTQVVRPIDVWFLGAASKGQGPAAARPEIRHPPLYPAFLALGYRLAKPSFDIEKGFKVFEPELRVVLPISVLFTLATGGLVFLLGRRIFDGRVAAVAAVAYLFSHAVLADSISGLPTSLAAFLATAACYAAFEAALRKTEGAGASAWLLPLFLSAAFCVLGFLTRYALAVLAVPLAFFVGLSFGRGRTAVMAGFVVLFLAGVAPWLWRNYQVCGHILGLAPFGALQDSVLFRGDALERSVRFALERSEVAAALKPKMMEGFVRLYDVDLRILGSGFFVCFFVASFMHRFIRDVVHRFRWCLAATILIFMAVAALYGPQTARLMRIFLPLVVLYGAAFFILLLDRLDFDGPVVGGAIVGVVLALSVLPLAWVLFRGTPEKPYPPYYPPYAAQVAGYLKADEVVCTDIPEACAWYGNRASLLLPCSMKDLAAIEAAGIKVSGLYLTSVTGDKPYTSALVEGGDRDWLPLLNGRVPQGFPFQDAIMLPPGTREQLFLTDFSRFLH